MTIRILVVDDHQLFRAGVGALLADQADMDVVGEAGDGLEALKLVAERKPDLVLMDVSMRGMNGVEATRRILAKRPDIRVLCLSMHREKRFVSSALDAGGSGYMLKDGSREELVQAVRAVMAGHTYLSPSVAGVIVADYRAHMAKDTESLTAVLTGREREVLQLLAEGLGTAAIAERLHVSGKTVATHREHIMKKLGIHSLAGLTKLAIREGLTSAAADYSI